MQKIVWGVGWLWIGVLAGACGGGEDMGDPDGGVTLCTSNAACSDGVFCNGAERCAPEESGADARGCVTGVAPCFAGQECSEDEGRCVTVDCSSPDLDGDGVDSIDCGGEDCDDGDADRYPGNAELCDDLGKDEDCDPDTLGPDEDGDGYAPLACCNGTRCGLDCDDTRDGVSPEAVEACNGIDEDCDGDLDEGATEVFYRDLDGDGFGDPSTGVERACVEDPLFRRQADDCDDRDPATHPGAEEICDGVDNDCNAATAFDQDGDGDGHLRVDAPCEGGPFPKDDCDDGNPFAHGGAAERCSAVDDDCDGAIDEVAANDWCTAQARLGGDTEVTALCGVAASCVLSACGAGSADCDGVVANGCEVDTMADAANCGGCGVACPSGSCVDGLCAPEPGLAEDERMVALRANGSAACGVTDGGHAICWGEVLPFESHARPAPLRDRGGLLSGVLDVGIGRECLCALKDDGTVVCMGNTDGFGEPSQCGATGSDEVFVVDPLPVLAGGSPITDASRLTLGNGYGCLVRGGVDVGGTSYTDAVMCWGSGGLGDGTYEGSNEPVVVQRAGGAPLDRVTDLDGGAQAACAVRDREVWCWGRDSTIHGTDGRRATRVRRSGGALLRADAVEVGEEIACALDGSALWCWGVNYNGVLGSGLLDDFAYEEAQPIPGAWAEVAPMQERNGQEEHVCGRRLSGELECWGDQAFTPGVPCDGDDRPCIVEPQGAAPFTTVATGSSVSCALAEGWPWCWGWADEAQLGFDTTSFEARFPLPIPRTAPPVQIAAGFLGGCARTADGRVACWGSDVYRGEVGPDPARAAFPMPGVAEAAQVAVGLSSVCVRGGDGTVRCWGGSFDDDFGFLGGESARPSDDAYAIPGLPRAVELAIGNAHGCVIGDDASVWCWGESAAGATGAIGGDDCAGTPCTRTPRRVEGLSGTPVELALGGLLSLREPGFSCARLADGRVSCWGANGLGTLGDGTRVDSAAPVLVEGIDDAVELRGVGLHVCARRSSGEVWCWGADLGGTLGTTARLPACGFAPCASAPVRATALAGTEALAAGLMRTCASTSTGNVWCWGGRGFTSRVASLGAEPQLVPGLAFPRALGAANEGHFALTADQVVAWGNPLQIPIGFESESEILVPRPVPGL